MLNNFQQNKNQPKQQLHPLNYQTHPQILNYSKPKKDENFESELEELTKSMLDLCPGKYCYYLGDSDLVMSNF
ncbi:hypothetical protein Glove_117g77 [Diversispora epigaea]|uniref:Uncharacterized protein n=1 Tax=Diversispora epigaea TaxID=1348612 RepID=A0A397J4E0_9GLOM|nr:hypothetical protein Glove_117g77 [Diversispora epigaea]